MKRRFYLSLYAALLLNAFLCLVVAAVAFRLLRDVGGPPVERIRRAAIVLPESLPALDAADAPARLRRFADEFDIDIVLGDQRGPVIGVPTPQAIPLAGHPRPGWRRDRMGPVLVTSLDGEAWAAFRARRLPRPFRPHPFFTTLVVLAVVMAVGSYPVARWVTRRLETLARAVDRWGRGDLSHRAPVTGNDEVATLAATFNQAAERLTLLLAQQRQMLANASHELRSPLARLRMGLELIAEEADGARRRQMVQEIHRDIVELDGLIEDVLLFARADARVPSRPLVPIDLWALVGDEAARTGAVVEGDAHVQLTGDAVLMRHLVRNLLENAQRHGQLAPEPGVATTTAAAGPVRVVISVDGASVRLAVEDQGPGVPVEDAERIFAPFFRRAGGAGVDPAAGHGLGLALVRQVARYHGGEVAYRARAAGGSRFEVTLPLTPAPAG
ncbi:MAG: HAMP domain-containing sensor histidine kinase [Pseudomonadota bacterium]